MTFPRRDFLNLAAGAAAFPVFTSLAWSQAYPTRAVRWIVGYAPGGGNDVVARIMGQWFAERFGQPFIVENVPGAGTNIATEAVVKARPDGYTILLVGPPNAINATLYKKLNFNFIRDIALVGSIASVSNVVVIHPSVPAKTLPEFVAYAKANQGKVNMGSAGIGSGSHLAGELFNLMTGANLVHVPYRGASPALTGLLGGQVQVMFATTIASIEYVKAGKLRALAVTVSKRLEELPDIPIVAEFVPGYEVRGWYGIGVPKNTPAEIVDKLMKEITVALADPKIKARLADVGCSVLALTPADFGKLVADETEKWGKVIKTANITQI